MVPVDPGVSIPNRTHSRTSRQQARHRPHQRHGTFLLLAAALLLGAAPACGGDADPAGDGGDVSFVVTGAMDEEFEGYATFTDASLELGQFSPGFTDNRTFALDLSMPVDTGSPPPTGSYDIGSPLAANTFSAQLSLFEDGSFMNPTIYRALADGSGTVEITSSSDDLVEGTFSFEAELEDGSRISLQDGQFRAVQVQSGM